MRFLSRVIGRAVLGCASMHVVHLCVSDELDGLGELEEHINALLDVDYEDYSSDESSDDSWDDDEEFSDGFYDDDEEFSDEEEMSDDDAPYLLQ